MEMRTGGQGRLSRCEELERFTQIQPDVSANWIVRPADSVGGREEWRGLVEHIVDLKRKETITKEWSKSKCGWIQFDGFEATGWPVATIIRGGFVMRNGEITRKGGGKPVRFNETLEPQA